MLAEAAGRADPRRRVRCQGRRVRTRRVGDLHAVPALPGIGPGGDRWGRDVGTFLPSDFVDFAGAPHGPVFARDTARYFAPDGLHPSASANRYCLDVLMKRPALAAVSRAGR